MAEKIVRREPPPDAGSDGDPDVLDGIVHLDASRERATTAGGLGAGSTTGLSAGSVSDAGETQRLTAGSTASHAAENARKEKQKRRTKRAPPREGPSGHR